MADSAADKRPPKVYRDAFDMVNAYLRRFGRAVSVEIEPLDEDGYTDLCHGDMVVGINVVAERDALIFLVGMGELDAKVGSRALRRLLELNFLHTGDCAFAVDAATSALYLKAARGLSGLDYREFSDVLQSIAQVAEDMGQYLQEQPEAGSPGFNPG